MPPLFVLTTTTTTTAAARTCLPAMAANSGTAMMKAVVYDCYGKGADSLKHVEVPIPTPKNDEVLVKVEATAINPVDWKIQKGMLRPFLPRKLPFIPCSDVAGEVVKAGSGVKSVTVGDKIMSWLPIRESGGLAEYALVAKNIVKRPVEVSDVDSACLPVAGLTALQTVRDYAGITLFKPNNVNVLITAASGGVGHMAVQIAKLGGAHVTATCGARNIELVKSLGADEVIDYKTPEGAALKSPSGCRYDAVIHCATGIPWSTFQSNLAPNGKVIDITPNFQSLALSALKKVTFCKQQLVPMLMSANNKDLQILVDLVKEGKLKCVVDSKYQLSNAKEAWHRSMEGHATGKVVVIP